MSRSFLFPAHRFTLALLLISTFICRYARQPRDSNSSEVADSQRSVGRGELPLICGAAGADGFGFLVSTGCRQRSGFPKNRGRRGLSLWTLVSLRQDRVLASFGCGEQFAELRGCPEFD